MPKHILCGGSQRNPRGSGMAALIETRGFLCDPPHKMCFGIVSLYAAEKTDQA